MNDKKVGANGRNPWISQTKIQKKGGKKIVWRKNKREKIFFLQPARKKKSLHITDNVKSLETLEIFFI